ncbi:hypothetical protein CERSUDRAFT_76296 [Gelatoporia subvermispora B]|uniref:Uncharacterized protein n=1 Tax=Ceriporiopsis subvermispora (strain B) TaxID=914234 RepID=M2QN04_CERS8|nr:hypothetical protein CERSUDRAFT_76296 [Gelatoporia subvermispora B]
MHAFTYLLALLLVVAPALSAPLGASPPSSTSVGAGVQPLLPLPFHPLGPVKNKSGRAVEHIEFPGSNGGVQPGGPLLPVSATAVPVASSASSLPTATPLGPVFPGSNGGVRPIPLANSKRQLVGVPSESDDGMDALDGALYPLPAPWVEGSSGMQKRVAQDDDGVDTEGTNYAGVHLPALPDGAIPRIGTTVIGSDGVQ